MIQEWLRAPWQNCGTENVNHSFFHAACYSKKNDEIVHFLLHFHSTNTVFKENICSWGKHFFF